LIIWWLLGVLEGEILVEAALVDLELALLYL
jgi:hypothetical protein